MKPRNINQFRKLIKRYETIDLEEIKRNPSPADLTGFGLCSDCIVCQAVGATCQNCVYQDQNNTTWDCGCMYGKNRETYKAIQRAKRPQTILKAYRNRAQHLREQYPQYLPQPKTPDIPTAYSKDEGFWGNNTTGHHDLQ